MEKRLNRYIRRTLVSEGSFRYDPEGFLEIKLCCMMCLLQLLPKYEPGKDAVFLTYAHNFIFDSIRSYQMGKESWSLPSLTAYKKIRTAAWMQNNLENAVEAFMEKYKCGRKTADRFFREASCLHRRKETILLDDEEEERDILEELAGEEADPFGSPGDAAPLRGSATLFLSISQHHLHPNRRILLSQTPGLLVREDAKPSCSVADGKC